MPEKKEPGQIAYEEYFSGTSVEWKREGEGTHAKFACIESAVLAAHKPERAAGVWVHNGYAAMFIVADKVTSVWKSTDDKSHWKISLTGDASDLGIPVSEESARRIVEALGGTWPEPQPAPEVKP